MRPATLATLIVGLAVLGSVVASTPDIASDGARPMMTSAEAEEQVEELLASMKAAADAKAAEGQQSTVRRVRTFRVTCCGTRCKSPVDHAHEWLKAAQAEDGSWESGHERSPGSTGLALLSFLGAGYTHRHGQYKKTVRNGFRHLKSIQTRSGLFGPKGRRCDDENHAIATLAMVEAFRHTGSLLFRRSAQWGVDAILYQPLPPGRAGSWSVLALAAAKKTDLVMPATLPESVKQWLDPTGRGHPTGVAVAMLARIAFGEDPKKSEELARMAESLLRNPPKVDQPIDSDQLMLGTLAMFNYGNPGYRTWCKEFPKLLDLGQQRKGKNVGSWEPTRWQDRRYGRVGTTALRLLAQMTYYRYGSVMFVR